MIYFEQALSRPELHFKRLKQIKPILCDGKVNIWRTYGAMEAQVMWGGHRYLLFLPFRSEILINLESVEVEARERSRGPLLESRIFRDEMVYCDNFGRKHLLDIVLQEFPDGMMLAEAVRQFCADDLLEAVMRMKKRLDDIGFNHGNLHPNNIIICSSGIARPLRYWYAKWYDFTDNDIDKVVAHIESYRGVDTQRLVSCVETENGGDYEREGIVRKYKCGRYGFEDIDGNRITDYSYSWASNFCEGYAIVKQRGKMGVINREGLKLINSIYSDLKFDVKTGTFVGINGKYRYIIDYNGSIKHRFPIEEEELTE